MNRSDRGNALVRRQVMIAAREDKMKKFVKVVHKATGKEYRLHEEDLPKLQTEQKVAVYDFDGVAYQAPDGDNPQGKYLANVKYFVGSYLDLSERAAESP
jgi:hypothetical protein